MRVPTDNGLGWERGPGGLSCSPDTAAYAAALVGTLTADGHMHQIFPVSVACCQAEHSLTDMFFDPGTLQTVPYCLSLGSYSHALTAAAQESTA